MLGYYAGIGSRETPDYIQDKMTELASKLEEAGWKLRSGGAKGADQAFEKGVQSFLHKKIFGPNDNIPKAAFDIARIFHPIFDQLSPHVKRLMARNSQIVLGEQCDRYSIFVCCWTPKGEITGGTGQGLRIAKACNIPIYNLYFEEDLKKLVRERIEPYINITGCSIMERMTPR